jgi:hypothetical protein
VYNLQLISYRNLVSKFFSYLCVFSTSNVHWLSWGMLQNCIKASGSTPDLYRLEINMKSRVRSLHEVRDGRKSELWKNQPSEENICMH